MDRSTLSLVDYIVVLNIVRVWNIRAATISTKNSVQFRYQHLII